MFRSMERQGSKAFSPIQIYLLTRFFFRNVENTEVTILANIIKERTEKELGVEIR